MTQPSFLYQFARDEQIVPRDSHVTQPTEVIRLTSQNSRVLARLQSGPITNVELVKLSLNYRARISDLRAAGHTITAHRQPGGLTIYELVK